MFCAGLVLLALYMAVYRPVYGPDFAAYFCLCVYMYHYVKNYVPVLLVGSFLCERQRVLFPMCCVLPYGRGFDSVYGSPVFQLLSVSGEPRRNQVLHF